MPALTLEYTPEMASALEALSISHGFLSYEPAYTLAAAKIHVVAIGRALYGEDGASLYPLHAVKCSGGFGLGCTGLVRVGSYRDIDRDFRLRFTSDGVLVELMDLMTGVTWSVSSVSLPAGYEPPDAIEAVYGPELAAKLNVLPPPYSRENVPAFLNLHTQALSATLLGGQPYVVRAFAVSAGGTPVGVIEPLNAGRGPQYRMCLSSDGSRIAELYENPEEPDGYIRELRVFQTFTYADNRPLALDYGNKTCADVTIHPGNLGIAELHHGIGLARCLPGEQEGSLEHVSTRKVAAGQHLSLRYRSTATGRVFKLVVPSDGTTPLELFEMRERSARAIPFRWFDIRWHLEPKAK